MKTQSGILKKTAFLSIAVIIAIISILASTVFMLVINKTASAADFVVHRSLPAVVLQGQNFDVTITFTTTVNEFGQIGIKDSVPSLPSNWTVTVDENWCTPIATVSSDTANSGGYFWIDSYNAGTQFTVVYKVTVPSDAIPGNYSFAGTLGYKVEGSSTNKVLISGDSKVHINFPPTVTTSDTTDVTTSTATLNGNLSSLGDYTATDVLFKWGTVSGALNHETSLQTKTTAPVTFSASLAGLTSNTRYYFRAKATGSVTVYGDELSFITAKTPPAVTTVGATDITTSTANLSGSLSSLGDYTTVNASFEWGTTSGALNHETSVQAKTTAPVAFGTSITGLTSNTPYYFRAKVGGSVPVYGNELSFTTAKIPPAVTTVGATDITTSTVNLSGNLSSLGNYTTINVSFEWGTVSGALNHETGVQAKTTAPVAFSASITGLTSNTRYYFRAKATGSVTVYGDELSFITAKTPPTITTVGATDITTSTANLSGNLSSLGDYTTVNVSFEWGTTSGALNHETSVQAKTTAPVAFGASITGLTSNTRYYFRAKATGSVTVYGNELSFTTAKIPPAVTTVGAIDITASAANINGNLSSLGDYSAINVSFEWGTVSGALNHETSFQAKTTAPVAFSASLTGLTSNTRYYFRSKATGSVTVYGNELSFITAKTPPAVTTVGATDITTSTANLSGNLSSLGDYTTVNVSFEWGTTSGALNHETSVQAKTTAPVAIGASITGLTSNTRYYFRAKATGSVTVYGNELSFTTAKIPPAVTTVGAIDITASAANINGNLSSLGDYSAINVSFEWGTVSGALNHETSFQAKTTAPVAFSASLTGLTSNTRYYFRAKATGSVTVYGDELSYTTIDVIRQLPERVVIDKTFNVTISFNTSVNLFGQIEFIDESPSGWDIAVDKTWCTPVPDEAKLAMGDPNTVDYIWNGSYNAGTLFTVIYKVTVPEVASLTQYSFANGQLTFHIASGATCKAKISGDNQTEVVAGSILKGKTCQVNGDVLPLVTIELIKDGTNPIATTISDSEGNFTILATQDGDQTLRARIAGFRDESYTISVTVLGQEYTFNFKGKHGIIPNNPDIWYVLDCAALWKYPPVDSECALDMWKVLDVAAAWKYPTQ